MVLRAAVCTLVVLGAGCLGCGHTQSAQQPQGPPASASAQPPASPLAETSKFVLQSTPAFFSHP